MPIVEILLAGFVGTAFMTGLMTFIHRRRWANADMIRALGSLVTRSMRGAVGAGLVIHIISGAIVPWEPSSLFQGDMHVL